MTPGIVVQKLFFIAFALFVKAHRIALHFLSKLIASHCTFSHHICICITLFAFIIIFLHFCTLSNLLVGISRLMHTKVVKSASEIRKICKASCKGAKNAKVQNANVM
jgi:hypothetical protein